MQGEGIRVPSSDRRRKGSHGASDFSWIKGELKRQGKTSAELARHLGCHPTRISKIISGTYNLKNLEIDRVRSFLGMEPVSHVEDASLIRVVGAAAEGMFVDHTHRRARSLTESVRSPETEKWGKDRYALELGVPIDANLRIDKEVVICIPARQVKRKLAPDDLVHIECQEGRLTATLVRRVQLNRDGELVFANVHDRNMVLPLKTKVRGLVVGRIMTMK